MLRGKDKAPSRSTGAEETRRPEEEEEIYQHAEH
jgi:hypothetical protein